MKKKRYRPTRTEERFKIFLEAVKSAQGDYDILRAGWQLVDSYSGFHYQTRSLQVLDIIGRPPLITETEAVLRAL